MDAVAANISATPANTTTLSAARPLAPWSKRVRWIGGLTQTAFAAFWLLRGTAVIAGTAAQIMLVAFGLLVIATFAYAARAAAGSAPRPAGRGDKRIELQITVATVIEFAAAIALPLLVSATGHSDWTLPSIAITVGPLLLWLDYRVGIARYRPAGWLLTIAPVILVATISGTALIATTGIAAGLLLLATAVAGFRDLVTDRQTIPASTGVEL
jgi:hypothetical protein